MTVFLSKSRYELEPFPYSCSAVLTLPVATNEWESRLGDLARLGRDGRATLGVQADEQKQVSYP